MLSILTTSFTHFSLKHWESVLFELGGERAKGHTTNKLYCSK